MFRTARGNTFNGFCLLYDSLYYKEPLDTNYFIRLIKMIQRSKEERERGWEGKRGEGGSEGGRKGERKNGVQIFNVSCTFQRTAIERSDFLQAFFPPSRESPGFPCSKAPGYQLPLLISLTASGALLWSHLLAQTPQTLCQPRPSFSHSLPDNTQPSPQELFCHQVW